MATNFADRYGIPGHDVDNLSSRFKRQKLRDTFGSFDNFVKFCSEQGYKHGMVMDRYDKEKPHSPDNSFFREKDPTKPVARFMTKNREGICSFCKKRCKASGEGCSEYRKKWAENWNKNIHRKITEPKAPNRTMVFRYEHPDLVREGIIFKGGKP